MSPRPRKVSDAEVFEAAHRIMSRLGPAQWTLADIATEVGLTPAALVQRFGSKRGLMVALTGEVAGAIPEMFAQLRASQASPLAALRAYADCMARMGESPRELAHHLAYLQLDLTDPELHKHVRAQASATRAAVRGLLDEAAACGELAPSTDTAALARSVEVTLSGSLLTWAFYQEGPAVKWVRHDLDALVDRFSGGYAKKGGGKGVGKRSKRSGTRRTRSG